MKWVVLLPSLLTVMLALKMEGFTEREVILRV